MSNFKLSKRNALLSMCLIVAIAALTLFGVAGSTQAGPTIPSNVVTRRCVSPQVVTLYSAVITTTTRGNIVPNALTGPYCDLVDIQWAVTVGSLQTVTLSYSVSNDAGTWVTASTLTSTVSASANDFAEIANFGAYGSINATLQGSTAVTITAIGLYK